MQQLRDYQSQALEDLRRSIRSGKKAPLLVSPTGAGKTTISSSLIQSAVKKGNRIIFLAHRAELISQCSARLDEHKVNHGVIMARHWRYLPSEPVQVCSIQTLIRRQPPKADIVFIDEAHRAVSSTYKRICEWYPQAVRVGLTATPVRMDGRGLGEMFDDIVQTAGPAELTERGYLVPARVFAPSRPDLTGVHSMAGDYRHDELEKAVDRPKLIGDIVEHWRRIASDRLTIVFASGVLHSRHIVERFWAAGIPAEHLDGKTPKGVREDILERLAAGHLRVVSNCEVLTMGWDCPPVSCAVIARPTQSLALYLQQAGRILRPFPGKTDALILDHAGSTFDHGFVTDPREWSLDGESRQRRGKKDDDVPSVRICLKCYRAYPATDLACPECGEPYAQKVRETQEVAGSLVEIDSTYRIKKLSRNPRIAELQKIAEERKYKKGWVFHQMQKEGLLRHAY